jgi:hypothetical protein
MNLKINIWTTTVELSAQEISTIRSSLALTLASISRVKSKVDAGESISLSPEALEAVFNRLSDIQEKMLQVEIPIEEGI